jgi:hypothetical protein
MPFLKLTAATLLGTVAYLALVVLGWGRLAPFFAHPARIILAAVTFALAVAAPFSGGNLSPGEREDRGNRRVLTAFGVIGLLQGYLPAYTDRTGFWTIDGDAVRWAGVAVYVAGGLLRLWPVFVLGLASAAWWPSSRGIRSSRRGSTGRSATRAISGS